MGPYLSYSSTPDDVAWAPCEDKVQYSRDSDVNSKDNLRMFSEWQSLRTVTTSVQLVVGCAFWNPGAVCVLVVMVEFIPRGGHGLVSGLLCVLESRCKVFLFFFLGSSSYTFLGTHN